MNECLVDMAAHAGATIVAFVGASSPTSQAFVKVLEAVLGERVEGVRLLCLDVESSAQAARRYDVSVLPTVLVFRGGALQHRLVGTRSAERLWSDVSPYLV